MNYDNFIAEAKALSKSALYFTRVGTGEPFGYWHGHRPEGGPLICVRRGGAWLTVILGQEPNSTVVEVTAEPLESTEPLYAEKCESLPPLDAVFLKGSDAIEKFLQDNGWERTEPYNSNFPSDIPERYEGLWQSSCALYVDGIVAVIGGWHFPWPDGDWYELADYELVLWVLEGAEPWVEVFAGQNGFTVYERVT